MCHSQNNVQFDLNIQLIKCSILIWRLTVAIIIIPKGRLTTLNTKAYYVTISCGLKPLFRWKLCITSRHSRIYWHEIWPSCTNLFQFILVDTYYVLLLTTLLMLHWRHSTVTNENRKNSYIPFSQYRWPVWKSCLFIIAAITSKDHKVKIGEIFHIYPRFLLWEIKEDTRGLS